jgi:hypothetical protein
MNNKLFQGLLIGSLLLQGVVILSADAAPKKEATKKPTTPKPAKPESKPESKPEAKPAPEQVVLGDTVVRDSGILYELTSCQREAETLVCRLLLINKKKEDIPVSFKIAGTRFIDRAGDEYKATKVKIGSVDGDDAENSLIPGVPLKASVTFTAPPANVRTMVVIAISHSPGSSMKFRNVTIGGK